ncbi:hypothetical protein MJN51_33550, partial [Salmonella enterica subsp. enterica serovar Kentucky]|nr:hypothetical protein [Salmonella enterica subsp. enterica serovar Kentucky]
PQDAQKRGITHGDMVRIHNSRGICEIPAEVTPRIIPGVVAMQDVETPAQRDLLLQLGVHSLQGYLIGRPRPLGK